MVSPVVAVSSAMDFEEGAAVGGDDGADVGAEDDSAAAILVLLLFGSAGAADKPLAISLD